VFEVSHNVVLSICILFKKCLDRAKHPCYNRYVPLERIVLSNQSLDYLVCIGNG